MRRHQHERAGYAADTMRDRAGTLVTVVFTQKKVRRREESANVDSVGAWEERTSLACQLCWGWRYIFIPAMRLGLKLG